MIMLESDITSQQTNILQACIQYPMSFVEKMYSNGVKIGANDSAHW